MPVQNADERFEGQQLEIARQKLILRPDEEVLACVSLFNYSQMIFILMPLFIPRFLLKKFLFVVTEHRILCITVPAFGVHGSGYHKWIEVPKPCNLTLKSVPKEFHQTGNKVGLPRQIAQFVGRPFGFVLRGHQAEHAFKLAAMPNVGVNS